jgi:type IV secretory pathway VirB4 component
MFDRFLGARYRHTIMHAWRFMPSTTAQDFAIRQQKAFRRSGDRALEQAAELTQAANLIAGNRLALSEYANALTVFADDYPALQSVIEQAGVRPVGVAMTGDDSMNCQRHARLREVAAIPAAGLSCL